MIEHILQEDWGGKLPFGRITLGTVSRVCRGKGCVSVGSYATLFPDGRLKVKAGFKFRRLNFLIVPEKKIYIPSLVYSALDEFSCQLPFREFLWKHIRKKTFLLMMEEQKVNFMGLAYINWKL